MLVTLNHQNHSKMYHLWLEIRTAISIPMNSRVMKMESKASLPLLLIHPNHVKNVKFSLFAVSHYHHKNCHWLRNSDHTIHYLPFGFPHEHLAVFRISLPQSVCLVAASEVKKHFRAQQLRNNILLNPAQQVFKGLRVDDNIHNKHGSMYNLRKIGIAELIIFKTSIRKIIEDVSHDP